MEFSHSLKQILESETKFLFSCYCQNFFWPRKNFSFCSIFDFAIFTL